MRARSASGLTLIGVALATVVSACGSSGSDEVAVGCIPNPPPSIRDDLRTPDVRVSEDGVLETTLRASYSPVTLDGEEYETMNFEGSVPGPTLIVCPGDKLIVHFENDLGDTPHVWQAGAANEHDVPHGKGQLTNLHTHGLHVSPRGNSDNVFIDIEPGEEFTYEYEIPEDHPPGMYWYHPHRHGFVEEQVYAGMLGAIFVQGGLDELPGLADIPTRTLIVNSLQLGDGKVVPVQKSDTAKSPYFVNGVLEPEIAIQPGEVQRWQILNANDNAIVRLTLEGHKLYVLANDGNTLEKVSAKDVLLLGPAQRREVLVEGGPEGEYKLESLPFSQFQDGRLPASTVATMRSKGEELDRPLPDRGPLISQEEDLREAEVDQRHRLVYTERQAGNGEFEFLINGKIFNPKRIDQTMRLGEVDEWEIVNSTTEWHTFHIHVNDFQVIAVKGREVPGVSGGSVQDVRLGEIDPQDTVGLPPGRTVTMRTRPTDFTGKFVFHCHMLDHEDRGMMGVVEVEQ